MIFVFDREAKTAGIDGEARTVPVNLTSDKLKRVEWDGETGHEEWVHKADTELTILDPYLHIVTAWHRAGDPYYGMEPAEAEQLIREKYDRQLAELGKPYLENEQKSWAVQEQEARAYIADATATVPYITTMATTRGIPVAIMAAKIIENADLFRAESARILGEQQKEIDLLNS